MSTDSYTLQRVLVPLDGSTLAEEALPVAEAIAREAGADLHLVTVQPPMISPGVQFGLSDAAPPVYGNRDDVETYLARVAGRQARPHAGHTVTAVLMGDPADRLADYVDANAIDLVVMTTHGRGGFSRFWLGSVADRLVRRINTPMLVLRHGTRMKDLRFERIVIALDGSAVSEGAIGPAVALGSVTPNPLYTLVRVVQPSLPPTVAPVGLYPPDVLVPSVDRLSAVAAEYLEQVAERLRQRSCSVATRVFVDGAADQIVRFAERSNAHLIAMGTRGVSGFDRLMLGSVADKVVRTAVQPVLVAPAKSLRPRTQEQRVGGLAATPIHTDSELLAP
jgi:nucleotide-binding universal stress UspA family protein